MVVAGERHGPHTWSVEPYHAASPRCTGPAQTVAQPIWRILLIGFLSTMLGGTGCSRVSSFRRRVFQRETAVPAMELGAVPFEPQRIVPPRAGAAGRGHRPGAVLSDRSRGWRRIGESAEGRTIEVAEFGSGPRRVLLIGGIHGDEPEGLPLVDRLADEFAADPALTRGAAVLIVRNLNPDGTAARSRTNARGVDLNRNFPASNWSPKASSRHQHPGPEPASEPETQLLVELVREFSPDRIVVMHSTRGNPMVNYDGPARGLADAMSRLNGYVTSETIGYPTPGSLGSYAGKDLQIPIITLELPRGITAETAWQSNRDALREAVR